jgi:hypothetical protein
MNQGQRCWNPYLETLPREELHRLQLKKIQADIPMGLHAFEIPPQALRKGQSNARGHYQFRGYPAGAQSRQVDAA